MPDGKTWQDCCEKSIEVLCQVGIDQVQHFCTLQAWHTYFKVGENFPHPNPFVELDKEVQPKFFRVYPEAREELRHWANQNLELLNSDLAAEFIRDDLTNKFFDQYTNEMEEGEILTTKNEFLQLMNLKAIDTKTAFRWLKNLGFTYDVQKKVYFNDRHENPEKFAN